MKVLDLPPSLLLAIFSYSLACGATPAPTTRSSKWPNGTSKATITPLPSTGSGSKYASECWAAITSWSSATASWNSANNFISNTTQLLGGTSWRDVTYYENATTLCDGYPRVTYSPAISLSTGTITYPGPVTGTTTIVGTYGKAFNDPYPTCRISPSDCDPLWADYSKSLAAATATITGMSAIQTPPCMNQSAASSYSKATEKIYGCGACTIYGEGVELVYFPTSASRDMCATTPTASVTHYGPNAVITAYAGKSFGGNGSANGSRTAVVDGHTFTSGTAYISISKVSAVDRCSHTYGSVVSDAILALPSESVLSLRYRQNHFQRLMETDQVTGYPVSYADFNTPIPLSAWNGQNLCEGYYDTWYCGVIYENNFRPQLAIPPQITSLSPDFEGCQMWYNGLWDPPLALTEQESAAGPTLPGSPGKTPEATASASAAATPTAHATATALPNELPPYISQGLSGPSLPGGHPSKGDQSTHPGDRPGKGDGPTMPAQGPGNRPTASESLAGPSATRGNGGAGNSEAANGPPGTQGQDNGGSSAGGNNPAATQGGSDAAANTCVPSKEPWNHDFKIDGHSYMARGSNRQAVIGTVTCDVGGPAQTLDSGVVASYGNDGLVFDVKTVVVWDVSTATATGSGSQITGNGGDKGAVTITAGSAPGASGHAGSESHGSDSGDADTVTVTIGGQVETVVQNQDGGPIIIDGSTTLTPGGEATTLPNGQVISAAGYGLVLGSSTTLGVESQQTDDTDAHENGSSATTTGRNGGTSASGTSTGTSGSRASSSASATGEAQTGVATKMGVFEILNGIVVVGAVFAAVAG